MENKYFIFNAKKKKKILYIYHKNNHEQSA